MVPAHVLSTMLFQGGDAAGSDQMHWLVIFVGVMAFCSFVQFLVFAVAGIAGLKVYKSVSAEIGDLKAKAMPLVASVQGVIDDNRPAVKKVTAKVQEIIEDATPKVKTVTTNAAQASDFVMVKLHEYEGTIDDANQTLKDANNKTRAQVNRVDGMVSSALKATSDMGNTIHRGIRAPVVEVAGVVKGLKAALDVLVGRAKGPATYRTTAEAVDPMYRSTGPVRVPPTDPPPSIFATPHPSSNVAPSPGAAAVVEQIRSEKVKTIY